MPIPRTGTLQEMGELAVYLASDLAGFVTGQAIAIDRLCFNILDIVRARDFTLGDRTGKHPQLFATWTVTAAGAGGPAHDVVLDLFANSSRLIRSAHLAGQSVSPARLAVGKVPVTDEDGTPSAEDRIQVKLGKTTVTWDGHPAGDSARVASPVEMAWTVDGIRGSESGGKLALTPTFSQPMAGSLKVDGNDTFAKALRASPTRFVGPAYRGGGGTVTFR